MCRPPVTAHGVCLLRRLDPSVRPGVYYRPVPYRRDSAMTRSTFFPLTWSAIPERRVASSRNRISSASLGAFASIHLIARASSLVPYHDLQPPVTHGHEKPVVRVAAVSKPHRFTECGVAAFQWPLGAALLPKCSGRPRPMARARRLFWLAQGRQRNIRRWRFLPARQVPRPDYCTAARRRQSLSKCAGILPDALSSAYRDPLVAPARSSRSHRSIS